ncbi:MAG: DUF2130 domain-containing protein [Coprobacillus sp.]|nr:DUF2130 domain-containing protein [Coprobacillus sp.]
MDNIKVLVKDQYTLVLEEDAKKGDIIDLRNITKIDSSLISKRIDDDVDGRIKLMLSEKQKEIEKQKDKELKLELENLKNKYENEINKRQNSIELLNSEIEKNKTDFDEKLKLLIKQKENEFLIKINELKNEKEILEKNIESKIEIEKYNIVSKYIDEKNKLEKEVLELKNSLENSVKEKDHLEKDLNDKLKQQELQLKQEKEIAINAKDNEISKLKLDKTFKNVKQLGEELENWCNNEYQNYSVSGFENCTWEKDNKAVKDENGVGSKADYIFKVYANSEFTDENLLTSVSCEMKNEDPLSKNKKKNEDHYKKLDSDRKKKECEYALLISELEWNQENDAPIRKVNGYEKMYMVRPQYFITFLSIVESLGKKYKNLLLEKDEMEISFKKSEEIMQEFENFKDTIIKKFIDRITKELEEVNKQVGVIKTSADKIMESSRKIVDNYLKDSKDKIENYNIGKIDKKIKKIEQ